MNILDRKYLQLTREVTVAVGDTDFNRQLKPSSIMGYCQDIATEHADILGFGYKDLTDKNLVWVLIRMSCKILRSPKIGEALTITTLPEKPKTLDVNRGYYIYDADGVLVIVASSKWCVINEKTHKISRLAPVFEKFPEYEFTPFEPFDGANTKLPPLSDADMGEAPAVFSVQVTDLDQNLHMNNARYGDVILNACGIDTLKENRISRFDFNFMSQLFFDDKYEVHKVKKENTTFVEARKLDSDIVVFRALVEWQRN
jgi:acyl-ACP thioesterase